MLLSFFTFLAECSDDVPKRAQALVDALRLFQSFLVSRRTTRVEALTTSQVHEIETAFAGLTCVRVCTRNTECKDRVGTRGTLVHERSRYSAPRVGDTEEGGDRCWRRKRHHIHVSDACHGLVMLDLMLFLVELALA
jgi:hypothetical protein